MGIPLVALSVRPTATPQDLQAQQMQLRNLAGQNAMIPGQLQQQQQQLALGRQAITQQQGATQLQQQQLKDQQAITKAWQQWDGKDADQLPHLVVQNGGSGMAAQQAVQHILDLRTKASEIAKNDAAAGTSITDNQIKQNDEYRGRLQAIINAPADQKQNLWDQEVTKEEQSGIVQPGAMTHTYPGDAAATAIANHFALGSVITKEAVDKQEAETKALAAQTASQRLTAELPGGPLNKVTQDIAIATNPQIQAGKVAVAAAEGAARANIEAQAARGSNAALANVPPHLVQPATAAATKAGTEYDQAQSVSDRLKQMMADAKAGNVVAYQLIPQEGALQVTTSQGVKRINMAEIQNYGGGSLWQRMEGHIGKQLTGKSIPDSVLDDMAEMQGIQERGARAKYENDLSTINQNYGSNFKPVTAKAPPLGGPPASVTQSWKVGRHTLRNGQVWDKYADGTVKQIQAQ